MVSRTKFHGDVNNRDRPPRVELRPVASKVFSRTSLHKRSLAVTHNRYCIQNVNNRIDFGGSRLSGTPACCLQSLSSNENRNSGLKTGRLENLNRPVGKSGSKMTISRRPTAHAANDAKKWAGPSSRYAQCCWSEVSNHTGTHFHPTAVFSKPVTSQKPGNQTF